MTSPSRSTRFSWQTHDLRSVLPEGWRAAVLTLAAEEGRIVMLDPSSETSREEGGQAPLRSRIVGGATLVDRLPWLRDLYHGYLRDLIQESRDEQLTPAGDPQHGMLMQIQDEPNARYECHVDSAPITCLLYATDQPPGTGGELTVSNRGDVRGTDAVDVDASRIRPVAGHMIVIDGRQHTHYVSAMTEDALVNGSMEVRVAIAMTYFTPTCTESMRPADLDGHLGVDLS